MLGNDTYDGEGFDDSKNEDHEVSTLVLEQCFLVPNYLIHFEEQ